MTQNLTGLFNVFVIIYLIRGLQIIRRIWNIRADWLGGAFTPREKGLAEQASFLLAVPVSVFFHELAHAASIWFFGGAVEEFAYRFFYGYVRPTADSFFSPAQWWFIALAGTLGSLAFGAVLWLALRRNPLPAVRYFGLRAFRFQIFFSLIYYPVFTLLGFDGDWRIIYDDFKFEATPVLSGLTLVVHLGLLGLYWRANRNGWFEKPTFLTTRERQQFTTLEEQAVVSPHDARLQLQLVDAYRQHGEKNKARQHLRIFLKDNPNSAEGYLQLAALQAQDKRQVPKGSRDSAAKALSLGLSNPAGIVYANQLLGQYSLGVGRIDEAIGYFNQGLATAGSAGQPDLVAQLRYHRAVAYRRKGQYDLARRDIEQAIELARASGQGGAMSHYQAELATIENHAVQSHGLKREDRFRGG